MRNLTFSQQIQLIGRLAGKRLIPINDPFLQIYPELLSAVQTLRPLDRAKLVLAAHAVFGWMTI